MKRAPPEFKEDYTPSVLESPKALPSLRTNLRTNLACNCVRTPIYVTTYARFKTLKIRQKLGFEKFSIFFRLKPAPGHGISENTKFSPTAFVVWEPIRLGRTDGRTYGQTDGRRDPISWSRYLITTPSGFDKKHIMAIIFKDI